MAASEPSDLLADPPPGRHIVQIQRSSTSLVEAGARYIADGLHRKEPVIAFVERDRQTPLLERLEGLGVSASEVILRDARPVLDRFMRGETPDGVEFRRLLRGIFQSEVPPGSQPARLYDEMVGVLWHQRRSRAALLLERLWNDVVQEFHVRLYSGYLLDSHDPAIYREPVHEIGQSRVDVVPTPDDERLLLALETACQESFGFSLERMMGNHREELSGKSGLPPGPRAMIWILRHLPGASTALLNRARELLQPE